MRIALLALVLASQCFAAVSVLPRWALPTRQGKHFELAPHERTRPILMGDILFYANLSGDVVAIHRTDNYVLWKTKVPGAVDGAFAYGRSKLFVGDNKGNLTALNSRDGSKSWEFKIQAEWLSPPVVVKDKVFVASSSDEIYALSETQGKELWHYSHRGDEKMTIRGTASPAVYGNEVFQGFSDGYLVALSAMDGKVLWPPKRLRTKERFYDVDATPFVDEKGIIAATFDGTLYNLDRLTGNTNRVFRVGSYGGFLVEDNRAYFAGLNGNFYAIDRNSGEIIWKTPFAKGVGLAPARSGDYLVFTTSGDPVYVVDPKDGHVVWTGDLGAGTFAAPVANLDSWFYCMSNYGVLYSFEIQKSFNWRKGPETLLTPSAILRELVSPGENNFAS